MARLITVANLILMGKQRADMENSQFMADAEWQRNLNTLYAELCSLAHTSGHRYFESTQNVATDGTNDTFSLNADFMGILGVDWVDGTTNRALYEETFQERNRWTTTVGSRAYSFCIKNNNPAQIVLRPKPPTGQTYKVTYIPEPTDISGVATNTQVDVIFPGAGEDFLTWGMARQALAKEESDVSVAMANFERAKSRIEEVRENRALISRRTQLTSAPPDPWSEPDDPANWRR